MIDSIGYRESKLKGEMKKQTRDLPPKNLEIDVIGISNAYQFHHLHFFTTSHHITSYESTKRIGIGKETPTIEMKWRGMAPKAIQSTTSPQCGHSDVAQSPPFLAFSPPLSPTPTEPTNQSTTFPAVLASTEKHWMLPRFLAFCPFVLLSLSSRCIWYHVLGTHFSCATRREFPSFSLS